MDGGIVPNLKNVLWYVLAGTKGGPTRIKILKLLKERPYNSNQLSTVLKMDYKTVQHHLKVLEENRMITTGEEKYGKMYFLSQIFEQSSEVFEEISNKIKVD
jgi:DNA-binding transcriptional ArsR family regulator